jgi:hypothetical protein
MPELVHENDDGEDEQERQQDSKKTPQPADSLIEKSHNHASPSPTALRPRLHSS